MRDWTKEIVVGLGLAAIAAMAIKGVNLGPLFIVGGLGFVTYYVLGAKAGVKSFGGASSASAAGIPDVKFDDIGGQDAAKRELAEALEFLSKTEKAQSLGIRPLKGILLVGPPGTGKTLLAKAAANYTGSAFLSASGSEFIEVYAGVGAQRVRQVFRKAREMARRSQSKSAIIFIDEIDVLGGKRGKNLSHMEYDQTVNQLLVEMDGIKVTDDVRVLVMAATNRGDLLDPALLRPGRFDRLVRVDLPDRDCRLRILKIHTSNKPLAPDVNLEKLAQETYGFSGAHLESLTNEAAIQAMRESADEISMSHFRDAVEKVMMGERMDRRPSPAERERIAVHESGHALMAEIVRPGSVSRVTITSRSNALGYVRHNPEDDIYLYTKEYIEDQISIALAGAVAEELTYGNRSSGAAGDFEQAVSLARKIISGGMSELGIVGDRSTPDSLIYTTMTKMLSAQEQVVRAHLEGRVGILRRVSKVLLEREALSGDEFREFIARVPRQLTLFGFGPEGTQGDPEGIEKQ